MISGVNPEARIQNFHIEKDTACWKTLSTLPFVGLLPYFICNFELVQEIEKETNPARVIRLIEVKNHFITASMISSLLALVLVVVGVAAGILTGGIPFMIALPIATGLVIGISLHRIIHNRDVIEAIRNGDRRPEMLEVK